MGPVFVPSLSRRTAESSSQLPGHRQIVLWSDCLLDGYSTMNPRLTAKRGKWLGDSHYELSCQEPNAFLERYDE